MHCFLRYIYRYRRTALPVIMLVTLAVSVGCLRHRWHADDAALRDHPAIPKQDFGRRGERRGQAGWDERSRQIESSLGIEGDPPRFFER